MLSVNSYQNSPMVNFGAVKNPLRNRGLANQLMNEAVQTTNVGTKNGQSLADAFNSQYLAIRRLKGLPSQTKTSKRVRTID